MSSSSSPTVIEKPWGSETIHFVGQYCCKELFMRAGEECSLQYHRTKTETVVVISGRLLVKHGQSEADLESRILLPGQTLHIDAGTVHQMHALEDSVYFEASSPELDDVVRLSDKYGR